MVNPFGSKIAHTDKPKQTPTISSLNEMQKQVSSEIVMRRKGIQSHGGQTVTGQLSPAKTFVNAVNCGSES
jgi:hypothetical protein